VRSGAVGVRTNTMDLQPLRGASEAPPRAGRGRSSRTDPSDPDVTPHRRRRRPLLAGRHVPVNEPLRGIGEMVVGIEGALEHLAGRTI
jgi:hypothetical protein